MRIIQLLSISLLALLILTNTSFADITSPNLGEQAMVNNLRAAIEANPYLKSQKIVIGAGISGCEAFKLLPEPGVTNILLTWQWLEQMKDLAQDTIIVVPEHALDENFNSIQAKVRIIKIDGVLHSRTLNNIAKEKSELINQSTELIVMLAGDTQQQDGTWKLYTQQMVSELIRALPTDKNILFLNGARTGKYKNIDGIITLDEMAHKTKIDNITQFVIEASINKPWKVIDFKFGQDSLWGAALKFCLDNPKALLILPGESTSMISEALTLGIRPIIYKHGAMTSTSERYINNLVNQGKVILYSNNINKTEYRQEPLELQENKIIRDLGCILKSQKGEN